MAWSIRLKNYYYAFALTDFFVFFVVCRDDYIIIDTPPVLAVSDAIITAQYADKVLMVTRYNVSIEGQLAYAIKQMQKSNIIVDGIVLNDVVRGITDKYSYHYSYAYDNSKD
ncbi:tyrosine-protein kinase family protein [Psychrobacter sanguinis]|uniref:tyrosine-protein kinase family protein n=1 Tax=Psychrobacter sanguinis TaxID=861445 RepID=UPI001D10FF06|nr:hypothetical protein [Psychrobacter sanguinis]MCC3308762.1 hypothetical protein [Psychrobacter sanguinis]